MIRSLLAAAAITAVAIGAAPIASADPHDQLWGMMPAGYGPDSCHPDDFEGNVVLQCGPIPGGPSGANFMVSRDLGALQQSFELSLNDPGRTRVPCADGVPAKAVRWGAGDRGEGWMFCSYPDNQGHAEIIWTRESSLFWAHIDGPDFASLKQWWVSTGNKAG